jgi:hypothetical protein
LTVVSFTRAQKLGLGFASMWPILYLGIILATMSGLKRIVGPVPPDGLPIGVVIVVGVHIATIALGGGVTLFYMWYAFRGGRVPREKRMLWAMALLFGSIFAIVPFFWRYVWPESWEARD